MRVAVGFQSLERLALPLGPEFGNSIRPFPGVSVQLQVMDLGWKFSFRCSNILKVLGL